VLYELCHVSDHNFKDALTARNRDAVSFDRFYSFFQAAVDSLWGEYFANKYSHGPWSDAAVDMSRLNKTLPPLRQRMEAAVLQTFIV
jgi:hypothetical protein